MGAYLSVSKTPSLTYRLGNLLFQISEHFWTRFTFAAVAAAAVAIVHVAAHESVMYPLAVRWIANIGDVISVSAFVFALTYIELTALRERRVKVLREVTTITELNHNVRNALQAIQYATHLSPDRTQIEIVTSAVERIDNILRELFPVLGETKHPQQPHGPR
jgi:hypothetical protein